MTEIKKKIKKSFNKDNLSETLKKIIYYILSILNIVTGILLGNENIKINSYILIILMGITSVFLFLAAKTDEIAHIINKYQLLNNEMRVRLDSVEDLAPDIEFIKSKIDFINSGPNSIVGEVNAITTNEPIQMSARGIDELNERFNSRYDIKTDCIYFTPRITPRVTSRIEINNIDV